MGSLFSKPPAPPPVPVQPPAAYTPTRADPRVAQSGAKQKASAAAAGGASGTNPTGAQGLKAPPKTANATLLGATE